MMGQAQFQKGDFDEAAATFSYMSRLYQTQPQQNGIARAWLARCYTELDWLYDAEDVIRNMSRDSIHYKAQNDWDAALADYYLKSGEFEKAVPYLRKTIRHEKRKTQKAREWFLMGQVLGALGQREEAYKAYQKAIRQNPPYELEFNARIAQTEVMAQGNAKKMISRLKRMARVGQQQGLSGSGVLCHRQHLPAAERHHEGHCRLRERQREGHTLGH